VFIQQLGFNVEKGVYLKEKMIQGKFTLFFNKKEKKLILDKLPLDIAGHRFNFDGYFNFGNAPSFKLALTTKKIDQAFACSLLTERISKSISKFKIEKPVRCFRRNRRTINTRRAACERIFYGKRK
jgi:hypothetical protein